MPDRRPQPARPEPSRPDPTRHEHSRPDPRDTSHREFGRDGVSGLLVGDRAMRARDVSQPAEDDLVAAEDVVESLIARASGRRRG